MKESFKITLLYILVFIVIVLIVYLVNYTLNYEEEEEVIEEELVSDECKFDISLSDANNINSLSLCAGYNELNVTDVMVDGANMALKLVYYNGYNYTKDSKEGVYVDDLQVIYGSSLESINNFGVFGDLLFIKTTGSSINVMAFDKNGSTIYNLESVLYTQSITDPAFNLAYQTDNNIVTTLDTDSIDPSSFSFSDEGFTFNSYMDCTDTMTYSGTSYKVSITDQTLSSPEVVEYISCQ